jgi:hypothetical protein
MIKRNSPVCEWCEYSVYMGVGNSVDGKEGKLTFIGTVKENSPFCGQCRHEN